LQQKNARQRKQFNYESANRLIQENEKVFFVEDIDSNININVPSRKKTSTKGTQGYMG
jgi:hypothetical protein